MHLGEALLAIVAFLLMILLVQTQSHFWDNAKQAEQASRELMRLGKASQAYAQRIQAVLVDRFQQDGTTVFPVELTTLKEQMLLAPTFAQRNLWGQEYSINLVLLSEQPLKIVSVVVAQGNSQTKNSWFVRKRLMKAAKATVGGWYKPTSAQRISFHLPQDAICAGNATFTATSFGYATLPEGSWGMIAGLGLQDKGLDTSLVLHRFRVGYGQSIQDNSMQTSLDMHFHALTNLSASRIRAIQDGVFYYQGQLVTDQEQLAMLCRQDTVWLEQEQQAFSLEGAIFLDKDNALLLCSQQTLRTLFDSQNAVLIKAVSIVPFGTVLTAPSRCPVGTVRTVYALPNSVVPKGYLSALQSDSTLVSEEKANLPLRYFGTAAQLYSQERTDSDGQTSTLDVFDFPQAYDLDCTDPGHCLPSDHHFDNLVLVACQPVP